MTQVRCLFFIALVLASSPFLSRRTAKAEEHRLETRLPANTIASVSAANFKEAWEEFQQTDLGRTGFGAHFDALRKELIDADKASMLHLKPWWGFDWVDLKDYQSEAALVVVRNGKEIGAAWWLKGDPTGEPLRRLQTSVGDYFKEHKLVPVNGKFGEADWVTHVAKGGDDPATKAIGPILVTGKTGIYVASDWKTAESFADIEANPKMALAVDSMLESIYPEGEPASKGRLRVFVHPGNIVALIRPRPGAKRLNFWQAFWRRACMDIKSIGLRIDLSPGDDEEIRAQGTFAFRPPPAGKADLPILKPTARPTVPDFISDDVGSVMKFGIHADRLAKRLGEFADVTTGEPDVVEQVLDGLRDDPTGPRVDVRKDMIGQLGDSLLHFMDGKHPPDRRASAIRRASLFPIADEAKVAAAAEKLWDVAAPGPVLIHGYKAFVCPTDFELISRTEFRAASVWTKEKTFAIGNNKDFFEHLFEATPTTPLIKSEDFQCIDRWWKEVEGKETCAYAYFSPEYLLGNAYQEVIDAKILKDAKGRGLPEHPATGYLRFLLLGDSELPNALKSKSLPPADKIMSNWPALGWTLANSEKGMRFELVWLGANRKGPTK